GDSIWEPSIKPHPCRAPDELQRARIRRQRITNDGNFSCLMVSPTGVSGVPLLAESYPPPLSPNLQLLLGVATLRRHVGKSGNISGQQQRSRSDCRMTALTHPTMRSRLATEGYFDTV